MGEISYPSTTNYRTSRGGFMSVPELRRYEVCRGFPFCKDQFQVKYLEDFEKSDVKHNNLVSTSLYPSAGVPLRAPTHKKESRITPKELLPSWTDFERRAYVDHFYVLSQQHRARYTTQNPYDACRIYDYFKLDENSPGFTAEFFHTKPKYLSYKNPQVFPIERASGTRKADGGYFYTPKRAEGS